MREIRTLRSMSGERKRSDGSQSPKPPRLSSTLPVLEAVFGSGNGGVKFGSTGL